MDKRRQLGAMATFDSVGVGDRHWPAVAAGLAATLLGVGLARFAYPPLIPALVDAGWFSAPEAAYLGAANLAGYAAGALGAARLADAWGAGRMLAAAMALAAAAFLACAWPASFGWFFTWRLASGVAGGVLMALAAPTVLAVVPLARRGLAAGLVFTGVGLGVAASGAVAPLAGAAGPTAAWLTLAGFGAVLTIFAAPRFPHGQPSTGASFFAGGPLRLLLAAYACDAVGFIPHTVFLADFVARGLGQGLAAGAFFWTVFGLGATLGPVLVGLVADRCGFAASLCAAFCVKAAAVAAPLVSTAPLALGASSFLVGALTTGIVALAAGRAAELAGPERRTQAWGAMTAAFAVAQAAGAYGFTALFAMTDAHPPLFALGAMALLLGAGLERLSARAG